MLNTLRIQELSSETYQDFLICKTIPRYDIQRNGRGWLVEYPAEYADRFGQEPQTETPEMPLEVSEFLFDRQRVAVHVCWHKKRYALFWDAGLGKTLVFLELARQLTAIGKKCLIVSPLNVIPQTMEAADEFYSDIMIANYHGDHQAMRRWRESPSSIVGIVNHAAFRRLIDLSGIDAVLLDESSILKNPHGSTRNNLIDACKGIEYKFAFSATQAPNDRVEYAQSAVWLEMVRTDTEFQGMYFVHKGHGYELRRHRVEGFYRDLASWSMFMRDPAVYGLENNLSLEPYEEIREPVPMTQSQLDLIRDRIDDVQRALPGIPTKPNGFVERGFYSQVSKGFLYERNGESTTYVDTLKPQAIRRFLLRYPGEKAIVWTVYDEEGDIILRDLQENTDLEVFHLTGKTPVHKRADIIERFRHGEIDVVISKPRLLGLGLNLHAASLVVWSGLADSYEQYYQGNKRVWRYPQKKRVKVFLPYTTYEGPILENVLHKQEAAERDYEVQERLYAESLYDEIADYLNTDWRPAGKETKQMYPPVKTDQYEIYHVDSIEATLGGMAQESADLVVTSIPFRNDLFAYTDHPGDMGNSGGVGQAGRDEFMLHLSYCLAGIYKTLKPGRLACIEISQSPLRLGVDGVIGMSDFRGDVVRMAEEQGFIHWAEIPVLGNPQAEAIVKHIATLTMDNFNKDRCNLAPMILDYIIVLKKPGKNEEPVQGDDFGTFESWIEHADGAWQIDEFNNGAEKYGGVPQGERFRAYLDKFEVTFNEAMQLMSGAFFDIDQTATLNTPYTRGVTKEIEDADKHVCPFSLPLVNRLIRLWSNPGDTVLDPFGGVGSVLHEGIKLDRFVISMELKAEYFLQSVEIADRAANELRQLRML